MYTDYLYLFITLKPYTSDQLLRKFSEVHEVGVVIVIHFSDTGVGVTGDTCTVSDKLKSAILKLG